jgi:RelE toxin of RelEB toxin-antitoxin system
MAVRHAGPVWQYNKITPMVCGLIIGVQWHTISLDSMVSNGVQRKVCKRSSRRPLTSQLPTSSLARRSGRTSWHSLRLTPKCGDVIRGTGGFRKVRVARKGMGKSGGARVVYIWRNERFPVFLITVFPKNEKENLSMAERNALKKRADSIFETYGGWHENAI